MEAGTEQLQGPVGPPVTYAPAGLRTTVEVAQAEQHIPGESSVEQGTAEVGEFHGLSSRERYILTQMKNAMMQISQQNEELLSQNMVLTERLSKLEDERSTNQTAWQSAEGTQDAVDQAGYVSGEPYKVDRSEGVGHNQGDYSNHELGSISYEQGFQQGYIAAKEALQPQPMDNPGPQGGRSDSWGRMEGNLTLRSDPAPSFGRAVTSLRESTPPPNERRYDRMGCSTTPQGTPVPKGPPPDDTGHEIGWAIGARSGMDPGCGTPSLIDPLRASGTANAMPALPTLGGRGMVGSEGRGSGTPEVTAQPFPELPGPSEAIKDPFAPGDKVYWSLPVLADTHEESDPASRASDWIEMVGPIMSDLTPMSGVWWNRVLAEARAWYNAWTQASAIDRGLVRPVPSLELQGLRFRRLESRAYAMLLAATPASIRDEVVANRETHCVALMYHVLRTYQPGGLQERTTLLELLTNPGTTTSAGEAVQKLRSWGRALNRAVSMQVSVPDASLMLRGLDLLADPILRKNPHISFRCSQARTTLQLDHRPTLPNIREFVKVVQSEFEMLSLSAPMENNKKPRIAAAKQQNGDNGPGKGKESSGKGGDKVDKGKRKGQDQMQEGGSDAPKSDAKGTDKGNGKPCSFYLTPKGCSKGRQCTFVHHYGKAKGESRCYNCGSTEHRQNECTRPTADGKGQGQGKNKSNKNSSHTPASSLGVEGHMGNQPSTSSSTIQGNNSCSPGSSQSASKTSGDFGGAAAPGGVPGNQVQTVNPGSPNVANVQAQVLEEAQKLLKSLRIAALRAPSRERSPERVIETSEVLSSDISPEEERPGVRATGTTEIFVPSVVLRKSRLPTGLLDGGATHALRTAGPGEWEAAIPTRVKLAVGSQDLRMSVTGTVLSQDPIAPIVPLGLLVELLGCRVTWDAGMCTVVHPVRGDLGVWLDENCPVVSEDDCLSLIEELEQYRACRLRQALHIRAMSLGLTPDEESQHSNPWGSDGELLSWLKQQFPEAPDWLLLRSMPVKGNHGDQGPYSLPGLNRRARRALKRAKHIVIHAFSGRTKPVEFALDSDTVVVNVDTLCGRNLLDERVFATTATLCSTGKVDAVVGGPPCGTNSILRERGVSGLGGQPDGGPRPVRGRTGLLRFGLPTNTPEEQKKVEEHTVLIMRFLVLHNVADTYNPRGAMCAMENPQDPMTYLPDDRKHDEIPSIWAWPEVLGFLRDTTNTRGIDMLDEPESGFGPPSSTHPESGFGPPSSTHPESGFGPPSATYPESGSGPPSATYPESGSGPPSATCPESGSGPPSSTYPESGSGPPSATYPESGSGPPSATYPESGSGPPSATYPESGSGPPRAIYSESGSGPPSTPQTQIPQVPSST